MHKRIKEIIIYIVLCLGISNICWYLAYSNEEAEYAAFPMMIAAFLPMLLTLVITKITKEGWDNLGIAFHLKRSWKVYLLSIFSTVIMVYLPYPLMLLCFPNQVTTTFSPESIPQICLMTLLGTACFIECLGEELGWIGYLFPKLEKITGTVASCVLLGIIRGFYHIGILVLMEFPIQMFLEITVSNICLSFWMAYLYKKSKSVFPCSIHHGIANLLPILLVYENGWYYTAIMPMILCMLPAVLLGGLGWWRMRKEGMLVNKSVGK